MIAQDIPEVDAQGRALPPIEDAAKLVASALETPPELVEGLLHTGSKFLLAGGSKSFKTFTLADLGVSLATGADWWGRRTTQGRVLYVNLEIQTAFFAKRIDAICAARGFKLEEGQMDVWNLRGHCADLAAMRPLMMSRVKSGHYALIIIDPIYKCLGGRDENKAGDITSLMNELERLATDTGAAIAFGSHFSKGNQAQKESIDRMSGSGVFARDPDTILVMTRHAAQDAFTIEATLRNFKPIPPFCVRWEHPVMKLAEDLNPADLKKAGAVAQRHPTEEEFLDMFSLNAREPRKALFSNKELAEKFIEWGFKKDDVVTCRDRAERAGKIKVLKGRPHNEVLAGLPQAVEAFEKWEQEQSSAAKKPKPRK